jgi:tripartite-type tricarboxylate transporter receptor subunit TctC
MRGLATTCPQRSAQLPNVPTFAEAGINDFALEALAILAVHSKTPPQIVAQLNQAVVKIINSPNVSGRIAAMGLQARSSSSEQARTVLAAEVRRWRQVVEAARIPPLD